MQHECNRAILSYPQCSFCQCVLLVFGKNDSLHKLVYKFNIWHVICNFLNKIQMVVSITKKISLWTKNYT